MITTFLDPTQLPSRTQEQAVFDVLMGRVMQLLPTWGGEINAALGQFNAGLAGGAYALPYVFDAATADGDPGAGKLRLSNTTQSAATVLRLDVLAGGADVSSIIDRFDASTSDVKGSIRLVKVGDPSKWLTFDVMARTAPSGYRNLTLANGAGSSASPFSAGDGVLLFFQRNGDIGLGLSGTSLVANASFTGPIAAINLLNVFTSQFDHYLIEGEMFTAANSVPWFRVAAGGLAVTSGYAGLTNGMSQVTGANQSSFPLGGQNAATNVAITFAVELFNANGTSNRPKPARLNAAYTDTPNAYLNFMGGASALFNVGPLSGFQLLMSTGNIASATVRVYGFKNS